MNLMDLIRAIKSTRSFGGKGDGGDIYKAVLGVDASGLSNLGREVYPEEPVGSKHHRMASFLATQQLRGRLAGVPGGDILAVAAPQLAGLGVEGLEAAVVGPKKHFTGAGGEDFWNDLLANWRGSIDTFKGRNVTR